MSSRDGCLSDKQRGELAIFSFKRETIILFFKHKIPTPFFKYEILISSSKHKTNIPWRERNIPHLRGIDLAFMMMARTILMNDLIISVLRWPWLEDETSYLEDRPRSLTRLDTYLR